MTQDPLFTPRRRRGVAERDAATWLAQLADAGVDVPLPLARALRDAAVACDRARDTDNDGGRLAYVTQALRAAVEDVRSLGGTDTGTDVWEAFYAVDDSAEIRDGP